MSVAGEQRPPSQALQIRMRGDAFHQKTSTPGRGRLQDKNVREVRIGGFIADHPGKADLRIPRYAPKQIELARERSTMARGICSASTTGEESIDDIDVEAGWVGADLDPPGGGYGSSQGLGPGIDGGNAKGQAIVFRQGKSDFPQDRKKCLALRKSHHCLGEVVVRLPVSRDDSPNEREDAAEIEK